MVKVSIASPSSAREPENAPDSSAKPSASSSTSAASTSIRRFWRRRLMGASGRRWGFSGSGAAGAAGRPRCTRRGVCRPILPLVPGTGPDVRPCSRASIRCRRASRSLSSRFICKHLPFGGENKGKEQAANGPGLLCSLRFTHSCRSLCLPETALWRAAWGLRGGGHGRPAARAPRPGPARPARPVPACRPEYAPYCTGSRPP